MVIAPAGVQYEPMPMQQPPSWEETPVAERICRMSGTLSVDVLQAWSPRVLQSLKQGTTINEVVLACEVARALGEHLKIDAGTAPTVMSAHGLIHKLVGAVDEGDPEFLEKSAQAACGPQEFCGCLPF